MFCQSCGMEVASTYKFCPKCGGKQLSVSTPNSPRQSFASPVSPSTQSAQAPALGGQYASFWRRLGAYVIDYVIVLATVVVIAFIMGFLMALLLPSAPDSLFDLIGFLEGLFVPWLYWASLESGPNQSTFGKRLLGMKVTDENGQRISFGRATGRYFGKILSVLTVFIGFLMVFFTERRQALHDKLAGTYILYASGR